jgi:hypothetical protein
VSDAELLRAYGETEWTITLPDARELRLRLPPAPPPDPALFGAAIITAHNPASRLHAAADNQAADLALRAHLAALHAQDPEQVHIHPALAHGTGEHAAEWDEPGYAVVGIPRCTAVALGEEFEQNAIVWIDAAGRATLVVTRSGFCGCPTGEALHPSPAASL